MQALKVPFTVSPASASSPSSASRATAGPASGSPARQLPQRARGISDFLVLFIHCPGALGAAQRLQRRGQRVAAELEEEKVASGSQPQGPTPTPGQPFAQAAPWPEPVAGQKRQPRGQLL
ncbi:hypothetical protein FD754_006408 [Muntiacus muntjak]|uniref:Uncharacterized protein n=1 Tax=Muntiacus muntjak TaxID=9888 RepID=A0A5N3WKC3_MUNMU|nr:hypothetical protein FD754_006408 [Muntiacus muntjak]